ncbi:MAG: tetratricopeptide repeat protein [Nitrospirae bacterium]|nr:tetratricopeptide repeat protein [Nitrospirota bacterium]
MGVFLAANKGLLSVIVSLTLAIAISVNAYGKSLSPEDKLYTVGIGAYEDRLWDIAILAFNRFLTEYPQSDKAEEAMHLLGVAYFQIKDYQQAEKALRGFLEKYPKSARTQMVITRLGETYLRLDNQKEAVNILQRLSSAKEIDPNADAAIFTLAETYMKQGMYKEAADEFIRFSERFPHSKFKNESYYWAGEALFNLERYKEARGYYKRFFEFSQDHSLSDDALNGIAWCEYKSNDLISALTTFNRLASLYPKSGLVPAALYRSGIIYLKFSKNNDAIKAFQRLVTGYPEERIVIDAHLELGKLYFQRKEYKKAASHLEKAEASEIIEMKAEASYWLGEAEAGKENYTGAIGAFEKILGYGIQDNSWLAVVYVKIGVNKERLKIFEDALSAYQKALEMAGDGELRSFAEERVRILKAKGAGKN